MDPTLESGQKELCDRYNVEFVPSHAKQISGFATSTKGKLPINGLRHPLTKSTTGWFIWCGDSYSEADDFFQPLHTIHIHEEFPEISALLGLPPGFRFLKAGDYLDIWFDSKLLEVER
jgi:hypothetical protein